MNVVTERLAVIAAVTLPITALSSVLGTNLIVNEQTQWIPLAITLVADDGRVSCEWAVVSQTWRVLSSQIRGGSSKARPTVKYARQRRQRPRKSTRPADWAVFAAQMGHDRALLASYFDLKNPDRGVGR